MDRRNKREFFCRVFQGDCGPAVLEELKSFARFNDGQFIPDPRLAAYIDGRRSVICEIENAMKEEKDNEQQ